MAGKKYLKLGNVNVGLANMRSMLNNESFLGSFLGDFEFYPKCVYVSVRNHFLRVLTLTWNTPPKNMTSSHGTPKVFFRLCYSVGGYFLIFYSF